MKIKTISFILFVFLFATVTCSMKHKNELTSFKLLRNFPLISFDQGNKWFTKLPKKVRRKVCTRIESQNDKRLTILFNIAINPEIPQDVKKLIAAHIFEDEKKITNLSNAKVFAEYENAARMFCSMSLRDVLEQYASSLQILEMKDKFSKSLVKDPCCKPHIVFEYTQEINTCRDCYYKANSQASKKELEHISKIIEKFSHFAETKSSCLEYYSYKLASVDNFKKQFNRDQFCLLLAFVASYILLTFPDACNYVLNQNAVEFNQAAREFNAKVDSLYHKTGNKHFWERRTQLFNEYICVLNNVACYHLSAGVTMLGLAMYGGYRLLDLIPFRIDERHTWSMIKMGMGTIMTLYYMPFILSYISLQLGKGSPWDIPYVVILYGLLCSVYNLGKMNRLQEGHVQWKDIPQLLQRADIKIV